MAAKQANYFITKLQSPTQTLRGHFGILHVSLGIPEENGCLGLMKMSGRLSLSPTGPGAVLAVQMERCSYKLSFGGSEAIGMLNGVMSQFLLHINIQKKERDSSVI